ncbi:H2O-forming NADH oxidase [Mycoplasma sp. P36-A1]|uniref:H2O-forming NADH oxidase n=1 Tax=Mycoplasma sp. P36-A1 TaxID=3252900 RepID=UPI003C2FBB2C
MEKIIVIGANHAGTFAINTMLDSKKDIDLVVYDKNDNISFLGCGMALWIGNVIDKPDGLFYATPEVLAERGAKINMKHELVKVDFENKEVVVKDLATQQLKTDSYDKLILGLGSWPILPNIKGIDLENVFYAKIYQNAIDVIEKLKDPNIKRVAVVGAGYIGVELVEAFKENGKEIILINDQNVLNNYYDVEFQDMMKNNLTDNGIKLSLGEFVTEIKGVDNKVTSVVTDKNEYDVDMVLMSIGFKPNTDLLKSTNIELASNGAVVVNDQQQSSINDVFAIGDCANIYSNATNSQEYIALATNAVRTGIVSGYNAVGIPVHMQGVQGSNAIHIYGLTMASTGISEEVALKKGIAVDQVTVEEWIKPEFMPDNHKVKLKVIWEKDSKRIIGAQMASEYDITLALHFFSLAIQQQYTIDKLALTDLFFLPHFNQPANFITKAGLVALTKL